MDVWTGSIAPMARVFPLALTLVVLSLPGVGRGEETGPPDADEISNSATDVPVDEPRGPESSQRSSGADRGWGTLADDGSGSGAEGSRA